MRGETSYAIQQPLLKSGMQAYVVRVSSSTATAGANGNLLSLDVDYDAVDPSTQFNLTFTKLNRGELGDSGKIVGKRS